MRRVVAGRPRLRQAVVTGRGAFLGAAAAREAGLEVSALEETFGADAARSAPAVAVALLYEQATGIRVSPSHLVTGSSDSNGATPPVAIDVVVKVGGSALRDPAALDRVLAALEAASCAVLIVPGGGPFADAVRDVDRRLTLTDEAAHWMAVRAMDQYAELLVSRLRRGVLVADLDGIRRALTAGQLPVLAPFAWLRREDPLPHSWEVTSDSIAAWVTRVTAAGLLVLVKPGSGVQSSVAGLTDPYFDKALPKGTTTAVAFFGDPNGLGAVFEAVRSR
jgi:aspartokinase-like uncharacterized kinase